MAERRADPTNPPESKKTYTRQQFVDFYGRSHGSKMWRRAGAAAARGPGGGAAAPPAAAEHPHAPAAYVPPAVWAPPTGGSGGKFAGINAPTAGARTEAELPVGAHPLQLYSLATPNGVKVTIMLEELGVEYDAYTVKIDGAQFTSGFVAVNPNSKIPAMVDRSGAKPVRVFESGAILLHLAEKYGRFVPKDAAGRAECLSWLMWQMGSCPYVGGGFGHFYAYAPEPKIKYAVDRFSMEAKRLLDVLDKHLDGKEFICGGEYTIADMAIWPWYGSVVLGKMYGCAEFLQVAEYKHVLRWAEAIAARPAVRRGRMVNRPWGPEDEQVPERHSPADFDGKAVDKDWWKA